MIDLDRWFALAPLALALSAVCAALLLTRAAASGVLLGLGAGLAVVLVPLLYPAFASGDDGAMSLGAAGIVGLVGASPVALGDVLALRQRAVPSGAPDT